jgi:ribosomal protein S18 acetylase RimI-like enzyme
MPVFEAFFSRNRIHLQNPGLIMGAFLFHKKKHTMHISIRKATQKDFPAIIDLIRAFAIFQKTPQKVTITLEEMEKHKDFFQSFVAETEQEEIIGFASFYYTFFSWSGKGIYLDDLYVSAQYRKQKIGVQLFNEVIELAKREQCKKLRWQVSNWNENAIDFYRKMGASIDDVDINCDLDLKPLNPQRGL